MCLVEVVGGPPKPTASCAMQLKDLRPGPNGEPPQVLTNSEMVKNARKGVMEFLLINHPLDGPICDQGGECDLQDQAMSFGLGVSRYTEDKRTVEDFDLGPLVETHMTRCISCTRCVRFTTEVAGIDQMGQTGRGENSEIVTYLSHTLDSELQGNIIDLCPVGALTSKPYAFTARSWELKSTESIDIFDSIGSNIIINTKGNEVLRILPKFNEELNEEWITDKVRFSYDGLKKQRLSSPFLKTSKGFLERTNWRDILSLITDKILSSKSQIAMVSGSSTDLETLIVSKSLLNSLGSSSFFKKSGREFDKSNLDFPSSYQLNSSLPDLENCDLCV
jgi:NADH-quinone oxidoreductase subunit G